MNSADLIKTVAGNIANLLVDLRQYDDAIEYFLLAESMEVPVTHMTAVGLSNFGKAYRCLGDLERRRKIIGVPAFV